MQIAKWGNSLAVRLPADVVRALGLKEGDQIEVVADRKQLTISRDRKREEALETLRKFRGMLPAGYKFDREEANARGRDLD